MTRAFVTVLRYGFARFRRPNGLYAPSALGFSYF